MKNTTEDQPIDKSKWGPGPWQEEPDRIEWRLYGYPCLMVRSALGGNWCGYVGVPPWHPFYKKDFGKLDLRVHGGLTYSAPCQGHICHVAGPGEPENVWWLGFDCAHGGDLSPRLEAVTTEVLGYPLPSYFYTSGFITYRDVAYVKKEVNRLALQIRRLDK